MSSIPRVAVVVGTSSDRSRTRVLAQALVDHLTQLHPVQPQWLELHRLAPHIATAAGPQQLPPEGLAAVKAIESADLVLAATPVYKGSYAGLFKHLFDLVGPDALVGRPVLLAATGGSDRHALVVDHQLRPLFAFFRALTVPSAVYASDADFDGYTIGSSALRTRIAEAAGQAALLLQAAGAARHPLRAAARAMMRAADPLPGPRLDDAHAPAPTPRQHRPGQPGRPSAGRPGRLRAARSAGRRRPRAAGRPGRAAAQRRQPRA